MNQATQTAAVTTAKPVAKPVAKYLQQREQRQRFSFGNAWLNAVFAGVVTDKAKLVAHGVKLKVGAANDLSTLTMDELLEKVQTALYAEPAAETADAAE